MTTLPDRPNSALLVIDVQNNVVAGAHERDAVVANVGVPRRPGPRPAGAGDLGAALRRPAPGGHRGLAVRARARAGRGRAGRPQALRRLLRGHRSSRSELAERGVGRVVVTGAQTDACIRATLHGAFVRGYDTVLVSDAHTTEDLSEYGLPSPDKVIAHTNMYWSEQAGPGRKASVVDAEQVDLAG